MKKVSARLNNPHYDPGNFLDTLMRLYSVPNDRQLAIRLGVYPAIVCKIRNGTMDVPAELLIHLHEETRHSIRDLRTLMGDHREHCGPSARHPSLEELSSRRTLRVQLLPKIGEADPGR